MKSETYLFFRFIYNSRFRIYSSALRFLSLCGLLLIFMSSCQEDIKSGLSGTDITYFAISGYTAKAKINKEERKVYLRLPSTVLSGMNLCPEFELSEGATASVYGESQLSGNSRVNFRTAVKYTIQAPNGTQAEWRITITNNDTTTLWGLGYFLVEQRSNNGERDFYRKQDGTGIYADYNCGPACATMAALWADPGGTYDVVSTRNEIGGSGYTVPQDLYAFLKNHNIHVVYDEVKNSEDEFGEQMIEYIKQGKITLLCTNLGYITEDKSNNPDSHVNKFCSSNGGHFLVIKGYKKVDNKVWLECHDPWSKNIKYPDGTYKGANRYYSAKDLATQWNNNLLVISAN